jgi:hypothetical protein
LYCQAIGVEAREQRSIVFLDEAVERECQIAEALVGVEVVVGEAFDSEVHRGGDIVGV